MKLLQRKKIALLDYIYNEKEKGIIMNKQECYALVFSSRTGNTKILAETIKNKLKEEHFCYFGNTGQEAEDSIKEASIIFVGFWTDRGTCDESIKEFLRNLKGKNIVLFGTAGFGGSEVYFNEIIGRVKSFIDSSNTIIDSYMCQGKMQNSIKERYEKMLENNPKDEKVKMLIANFKMAMNHPNEDDINRLNQWLLAIKEKLQQ